MFTLCTADENAYETHTKVKQYFIPLKLKQGLLRGSVKTLFTEKSVPPFFGKKRQFIPFTGKEPLDPKRR